MVHGMVAPTVTLFSDPIENGRMTLYVAAHAKKGRLVSPIAQHVEDPGRPFRMGPVIEGEVDPNA